jgi:hypothetical protein
MKKFAISVLVCLAALSLVCSLGCSKKSDPADAMIGHITAMAKIIKDNKADCNKVVKELEAYTSKHKGEFEELKKQGEEMDKKMSDEEKKEYAAKMMKKMGPMLQENMAVMMEVSKNCPEQAAAIGQAMSVMK